MRTITPRRPRNGLFAVADEVPWDNPDIDWTAGVGWSLLSTCPVGAVQCCDPDFNPDSADPEPNNPGPVTFRPFSIVDVQGCIAGTSRTRGAMADARAANKMWHETNIEGWVSIALESGVCGAGTALQELPDASPGVLTLPAAVKALIKARIGTSAIFDRPVLHLPAWYAGELTDSTHLTDTVDIAFGPGYGYLLEEEEYAYITGPVEYSILEPPRTPASTLDERRQNMNYDRVDTLALVRYDPCGSFKARLA
ncbi:MAG TPA: hypothetical protein PLB92_03840 [Rhodoglobus sp.]|nr:hypothetical protein [Rhodoglobus sp.]